MSRDILLDVGTLALVVNSTGLPGVDIQYQQDNYNKNRELWGVADDITRNAKPSNAAIDWRSLALSPDPIGFNPTRNIVIESSTTKPQFAF